MELDQLIVRIEADARPLMSALNGVESTANRSLQSVASLGDVLARNFTSAATRGENLADILRGLLSDLSRITLRETIINPAGNLLSGLIGGLFGRAGGGSVSPDTPYWVGERGPELFVPSSAGRIESSGSSNVLAAPIVTLNIDARGADSATAAHLQQVAADIQTRTFNAVFAAMERGGRYARMAGRRS